MNRFKTRSCCIIFFSNATTYFILHLCPGSENFKLRSRSELLNTHYRNLVTYKHITQLNPKSIRMHRPFCSLRFSRCLSQVVHQLPMSPTVCFTKYKLVGIACLGMMKINALFINEHALSTVPTLAPTSICWVVKVMPRLPATQSDCGIIGLKF